ncbi:MAG: magnesium/cobalt transporter CorA [Candidatus Eisenbacteria bacterium]|nr:magnesium/cobalt transporter CorA [Candidatus Eisenbacteria bacterium]
MTALPHFLRRRVGHRTLGDRAGPQSGADACGPQARSPPAFALARQRVPSHRWPRGEAQHPHGYWGASPLKRDFRTAPSSPQAAPRGARRRCAVTRLFRRSRHKVGLAPGTVAFVGEQKSAHVRLRVLDYDAQEFSERDLARAEEALPYRNPPRTAWLNLDGLHDTTLLSRIGEQFGIHPLALEDIAHVHQRPKLEDYGDHLYVVIKMLTFDEEQTRILSEQISLVLGRSYALSFQEREGDVFEPVRQRIRSGAGRARRRGADYLAYMLLDAVVDNYFVILERIGERIEALEERLVADATPALLQEVHALRREMILLRRAVWPLREVTGGLERSDSELISDDTALFLRDLYDHTIQVIDAIESYREMLSGLQDLYLSSISHRMNDVMKTLTIIATLFIPLSFLAGVFGMNFDFMPELHWRWSYPLFWVAIVAIGTGMLIFFRRRGWL